jgi:hypothetical protein
LDRASFDGLRRLRGRADEMNVDQVAAIPAGDDEKRERDLG